MPFFLLFYSGLTQTVNNGPNQAVTSVALSSYEVFTEITCQYVPSSIDVSDGEVITGSGKFEKNAGTYIMREKTIRKRTGGNGMQTINS